VLASAAPLPEVHYLQEVYCWANMVLVVSSQVLVEQAGCLWPTTKDSVVLLSGKPKGKHVAHGWLDG
jgi:hypothetical protein